MRPPPFKNATCRGSLKLGTACGQCEACEWERAQSAPSPSPLSQSADSRSGDSEVRNEMKAWQESGAASFFKTEAAAQSADSRPEDADIAKLLDSMAFYEREYSRISISVLDGRIAFAEKGIAMRRREDARQAVEARVRSLESELKQMREKYGNL